MIFKATPQIILAVSVIAIKNWAPSRPYRNDRNQITSGSRTKRMNNTPQTARTIARNPHMMEARQPGLY